MAATKRKTIRSNARKAVKKSTARMQKKPVKAVATKAPKKVKVAPKATARKAAAPAPVRIVRAPLNNIGKPFTKGQLFTELAARTGLQRKQVANFFDELETIIGAHIKKQGPGQFTLPRLIKFTIVHKPATKSRNGVNPFTGAPMVIQAKPARSVVKARVLKHLKSIVG